MTTTASSATPASLKDLPLHVFRPTEHLLAHLVNQVRPDGRTLTQSRPILCTATTWQTAQSQQQVARNILASKQVQIGGSMAVAVVSLLMGTPSVQKPQSGDIDFKVAMNHLLPSSMLNQRRNDEIYTSSGNASQFPGDLTPSTQEVEHMLTTVFNSGNIIDLTQLCVEKDTVVMRLTVHITVLSYAGNLRDLCLLASMLALREVRLPSFLLRPSEAALKKLSLSSPTDAAVLFWQRDNPHASYAVSYDSTRPLDLQLALPVTCAYVTDTRTLVSIRDMLSHSSENNNKINNSENNFSSNIAWFLDPTDIEEKVAEGVITFVIHPVTKKIVYSSLNTQGLPMPQLLQLLAQAEEHVQTMAEQLQLLQ